MIVKSSYKNQPPEILRTKLYPNNELFFYEDNNLTLFILQETTCIHCIEIVKMRKVNAIKDTYLIILKDKYFLNCTVLIVQMAFDPLLLCIGFYNIATKNVPSLYKEETRPQSKRSIHQ